MIGPSASDDADASKLQRRPVQVNVNSGFGGPSRCTTTSATLAVRVSAPLVPVMVSGYVPGVVAAPAVTVRVDDAPPVIVAGENAAVVPAGKPVTASAMLGLGLITGVAIVNVVDEPCSTTDWLARLGRSTVP